MSDADRAIIPSVLSGFTFGVAGVERSEPPGPDNSRPSWFDRSNSTPTSWFDRALSVAQHVEAPQRQADRPKVPATGRVRSRAAERAQLAQCRQKLGGQVTD